MDVPGDDNCFFTAHWQSKCLLEGKNIDIDINAHRHTLFNYAFKNWHDILANVYDSRGITLYGNFTRKRFNLKEGLVLKDCGDKSASLRIDKYRKWYEKKIMAPLWNDQINFKLGVNHEYYGTVRYHGQILALKFKQSICFYLHCNDGEGNSRYETYVLQYDKSNSSITCWSHDSYIYPPDNDNLLV